MTYKGRDIAFSTLDEKAFLAAACDSCGAVGNKELDLIKVSPYIVGRLTARVPLLEILAIGARPRMVTAAISCEPDPTGKEILVGIRDELDSLDLTDIPLGISTEKNIETRQTGLGVTVIGIGHQDSLRIAKTLPGDVLYCLGLPKVGAELAAHDDPQIVTGRLIRALLNEVQIHDILPVGSRGIRSEAAQLAEEIGETFDPLAAPQADLDKSAGPSTCLIVSCPSGYIPAGFAQVPLFKIGEITRSKKEDV